jgi:hypothetical protein
MLVGCEILGQAVFFSRNFRTAAAISSTWVARANCGVGVVARIGLCAGRDVSAGFTADFFWIRIECLF